MKVENEIDKTNEKQIQRGNPNWEKGKSANPDGRPKGTKNYLTLLEEALKDYETETGKKLFRRLIERAFINDKVLLGTVKKFIADKTHTEIETVEPIRGIFKIITDENNKSDKDIPVADREQGKD